MTSMANDSLQDVSDDVESVMSQLDLDRSEAFELLVLKELREIKTELRDIETHTNNTVRKL